MEERDILKEIEEFHQERIVKLKNNETPKPCREGGKIVLHLIPMDSFHAPEYYDILAFQEQAQTLLQPLFVKDKSHTQDYDFNGLLDLILASDGCCLSYVQLYRNGIIEAVEGIYFTMDEKNIPIYSIEQEIILKTHYYLSFQKEMEIKPPVILYLTFLRVEGYKITDTSIETQFLNIHPFDRKDLILPRIIIKDFDVAPEEILKISFDRIWNACGYPKSLHYDDEGKWIKK